MTTQERAKIIRELDKKYGAYCEKKVNEAWNGALEKAATIADQAGTVNFAKECFDIAKIIRALKYKL